jgi:hypothetical protein
MEMCDLLEVYSSSEKETLKRTHSVYMKESELSRSVAEMTASEETLQFVDMDTLRYQKIASQKVEMIRLNAEQRRTSNNIIDQSAFYSDIESGEDENESGEDENESGEDKENNNKKNSSNESEEEESEEEESEEEESEEEEKQPEKQNSWNKNKRVCKEEIDVDDI